jgi:hypothetical protein
MLANKIHHVANTLWASACSHDAERLDPAVVDTSARARTTLATCWIT